MGFDTGRCPREEGAFGVLGVLVDLGREALFSGHDENIMIGSGLLIYWLLLVERQADSFVGKSIARMPTTPTSRICSWFGPNILTNGRRK